MSDGILIIFGLYQSPPPPRHTHTLSLNNPEYQNFEKLKKVSGDVIILNFKLEHKKTPTIDPTKNVKRTWRYCPFTHAYYKSRSYDVWLVRNKVQMTNFLSFRVILCPLNPFEIWKKYKNDLEILFFYT